MLIQFYVSSHGYGHTTRVAQVCKSLLALDAQLEINIVTRHPAQQLFFPSDRLTFYDLDVDSGIVQSNAYTIDRDASWRALDAFVQSAAGSGSRRPHLEQLAKSSPDLIISDAVCPFPWEDYRDKPKVLLSNFSFDGIFQGLLVHGETARCDLVDRLKKTYARGIDLVLRLPGYIDMPFVQENGIACQDVPLVYRTPSGKSRNEVLDDLIIPVDERNKQILYVQFGGHLNGNSDHLPQLPEDWICLSSVDAWSTLEHFYHVPSTYYTPDIVNVASLVLGKLGYGTVSECVGLGTPLLMVERALFAEEAGLKSFMKQHGQLAEMSAFDYEEGKWSLPISRMEQKGQLVPGTTVPDGSMQVARRLLELAGDSLSSI
ncbi:hypothetical protein BCR37DRAFT_397622 [Protomyces lactucae-debilis]|uniref:Glycosyl transferase family 28 C-terminal domain-containing protein n=1 Tax=Protomyces lactucae-debilis TaxID=2754530 RepID=A0A1Y2FJU9_PROLT|nr:uncharacterized protein BCR37DRAFT_397622 [Protomyces lactucae-debilis]ORY84209.1 hypothetical protein BCR37DRAFT_397622 [Protomyces lactucae-debilis]